MLTNAYGEMIEFLLVYGKVRSDIKWASMGAREVSVEGLLLQLEGTFYYKKKHAVCLNPKMVLSGNGFWITREEDDISGGRWLFHECPIKPMFKTDDYHIWTGAPGCDSEKAKRLKIYVAGPYTAPTTWHIESNVETAIDVGIALFHKGHFPFIPHLTHYVDIRAHNTGARLTWEEYMMRDLAWLEVADAFFFIGESKGADMELEAARAHGLDIYYTLSDVPAVCNKPYEPEEVVNKYGSTKRDAEGVKGSSGN